MKFRFFSIPLKLEAEPDENLGSGAGANAKKSSVDVYRGGMDYTTTLENLAFLISRSCRCISICIFLQESRTSLGLGQSTCTVQPVSGDDCEDVNRHVTSPWRLLNHLHLRSPYLRNPRNQVVPLNPSPFRKPTKPGHGQYRKGPGQAAKQRLVSMRRII
jgi:hypothetical protein